MRWERGSGLGRGAKEVSKEREWDGKEGGGWGEEGGRQ